MKTPSLPCDRATLATYRNGAVVAKFREHWDVSPAEAEEVFQETLAWLWISAAPDAPKLMITPSLAIIDEMWHTFLLFTIDYAQFCERYLGRFVHHVPTIGHVSVAEDGRADRVADRAAQYRFICDRLGVNTVRRWYLDYPRRYDTRFFANAMKPPEGISAERRARLDSIAAEC